MNACLNRRATPGPELRQLHTSAPQVGFEDGEPGIQFDADPSRNCFAVKDRMSIEPGDPPVCKRLTGRPFATSRSNAALRP